MISLPSQAQKVLPSLGTPMNFKVHKLIIILFLKIVRVLIHKNKLQINSPCCNQGSVAESSSLPHQMEVPYKNSKL